MRRPNPDALLAGREGILRAAGTSAAALVGEEVRAQRLRWAEDRPQVVLVSGFSAGKTTLLKHWFGLPELPTGHTATTAAATRIVHGHPDRVILRYRQAVEVPLRLPAASEDHPMADVLERYASAPDDFHIAGFGTMSGDVFDPGQVLEIVATARQDPRDAPDGIVVHFRERPPEKYSLAAMPPGWLAGLVVTPVSALALAEVVCHARHRVLRRVSMVDTAGYGAAIAFHQRTSAGVLRRLPDTTIVLADARQVDEPRFRQVLADVWHRVRVPADVDAILIGLTHWQQFVASEADDEDDLRLEFDPLFHEGRLDRKRREIARLLAGRRWLPAPLTLPLELGPRPFGDAARNPDQLLHAAVERARRSPVPNRGEVAAELAQRAVDVVRADAEAAAAYHAWLRREADRLADRARALEPAADELAAVVGRSKKIVDQSVQAQRDALLAEVGNRRTGKDIKKFLETDYATSRMESVARLREVAKAQTITLRSYVGGGLTGLKLPPGPDDEEERRRVSKLEDILYSGEYLLYATIDFIAPTRTVEDLRADARILVRGFVRADMDRLHEACRSWSAGHRTRSAARLLEIEREHADAVARAELADVNAGIAAERAKILFALLEQASALQAEAGKV